MHKTPFLHNVEIVPHLPHGNLISSYVDEGKDEPKQLYLGDDFPKSFLQAKKQGEIYVIESALWRPSWNSLNMHGQSSLEQVFYATNDTEEIDLSVLATDGSDIDVNYNKLSDTVALTSELYERTKDYIKTLVI